MIDFRSDTVTKPTDEMLKAMMAAEVGDDVFQDDPTVNRLESYAAERFGKEAALFCPSGTMTNQIAIRVHTRPGDDVICDQLAHIYQYEGGGIAANSGCSVRLLQGDAGRFTAAMVKSAIQADDPHYPHSRLVSIENTSNKGGGVIWDKAAISEIRKVCDENDLALHLDGARFYNAMIAGSQTEEEAGKHFDSISVCLSKGLGCPVGSLLLGSKDFIHQARRVRKVMGGGMRQAGYLAAAGLYALDHHVDRLAEDHEHAQKLANRLRDVLWVDHVLNVETNIIVVELAQGRDQQAVLEQLKEHRVLAVGFGPGRIRFVTHLGISEKMIDKAISVFHQIA
jgi:threonine aldolase